MNKNEIEKVEERIKIMGLKKSFIAFKIGILPAQLSQYLRSTRPTPIGIKTKLFNFLGL